MAPSPARVGLGSCGGQGGCGGGCGEAHAVFLRVKQSGFILAKFCEQPVGFTSTGSAPGSSCRAARRRSRDSGRAGGAAGAGAEAEAVKPRTKRKKNQKGTKEGMDLGPPPSQALAFQGLGNAGPSQLGACSGNPCASWRLEEGCAGKGFVAGGAG